MIGIFDIDSLVYEACYGSEDLEQAIDRFFDRYNSCIYELNNRVKLSGVIPVGFCKENYRNKVSLSYKANRTAEKPEFFNDLIEFIKSEINVKSRRGIETDDLVVKYHDYYGKDNSIIISIDKDYLQKEGLIYNYRQHEIIEVSKSDAYYNFMEQMVCGDRADNIKPLKGYGPKWCEKNLTDKSEWAMMRSVYELYKTKYKSKAKEMYMRTYLLLKLNAF